MKIFFSHNSRDKPLLREIMHYFPYYIPVWIDEDEIIAGEDLFNKIKSVIKTKTDVVVFFLSIEALNSSWVNREIEWALDHEKLLRRPFIIPVILDEKCMDYLPKEFISRKYLVCNNFTSTGINNFAKELYDVLFTFALNILDNRSDAKIIKNKTALRKKLFNLADNKDIRLTSKPINKATIKNIIKLVDIKNRLLLLLLYELKYGKFNDPQFFEYLDKGSYTRVLISNVKISTWQFTVNYPNTSKDFDELRYEYCFGDEIYIIRNEILDVLKELTTKELNNLFFGIKIDNLGSEKFFDAI